MGVLLNQRWAQDEKVRSGPGVVGIQIPRCGSGPVLNGLKTTAQIKTENK